MTAAPAESLHAAARQKELVDYIHAYGARQVNELARVLGVSPSTVRRDLGELHERGLIERHHGGAAPAADSVLTTWPQREEKEREEKRRIGRAAAALVPDGATVLLLGGSTTEAMLPHLSGRTGLVVVTNSFVIAGRLAHEPAIEVVMLGGVLRRSEMTVHGAITLGGLAELGVDMTFTGAYGIDADAGITRTNLAELHTDRTLLDSAPCLVVLADHTKVARRGRVRLALPSAIHTLVTDAPGDERELERFRGLGVRVVAA